MDSCLRGSELKPNLKETNYIGRPPRRRNKSQRSSFESSEPRNKTGGRPDGHLLDGCLLHSRLLDSHLLDGHLTKPGEILGGRLDGHLLDGHLLLGTQSDGAAYEETCVTAVNFYSSTPISKSDP